MEINAGHSSKQSNHSVGRRNLFSHKLRQLRSECGLKQRELASLTCLDQGYVCGVESGYRPVPPCKLVERFVEAMNLTPDQAKQLRRSAEAARLQLALPPNTDDSYWQMYAELLPHVMQTNLAGIREVVERFCVEMNGCNAGGIKR